MPNAVSRTSPAVSALRPSTSCVCAFAIPAPFSNAPDEKMLAIIAATEMMNAAPRNSLMRKRRSLAREVSIITRITVKRRILTRIKGIASRT